MEYSDVVMTSRVRLARNLKGLPFPNSMTSVQMQELIESVNAAINPNKDFLLLQMRELPLLQRQMLVERHLISPDLAKQGQGAALVNKDETLSIMIGEEDHLRIQCLLPGLQLTQADQMTAALDHILSQQLTYAYDDELGYLSACPTNLGTGMRASVMVHLPAMALTGQIQALLTNTAKLGYAIRGIYGEGSDAPANIYQISNQITLGVLEEDILSNLQATIQNIVNRERTVRESLKSTNRIALEDLIYRSYGICQYARMLKTDECMEHLSHLKLGAALGYVPLKQESLNALMTDIQAASLQQRKGREMQPQERDALRAEVVRTAINNTNDKR